MSIIFGPFHTLELLWVHITFSLKSLQTCYFGPQLSSSSLYCMWVFLKLYTKEGPPKAGLPKLKLESSSGPQSPELNITEHLWDEVAHQLNTRPTHPTSVPVQLNATVVEWGFYKSKERLNV